MSLQLRGANEIDLWNPVLGHRAQRQPGELTVFRQTSKHQAIQDRLVRITLRRRALGSDCAHESAMSALEWEQRRHLVPNGRRRVVWGIVGVAAPNRKSTSAFRAPLGSQP
jgi:hypothetical protein